MLRSLKLATPAVAATVFVPARFAPLVPVPVVIASVTLALKPAATLPMASSALTLIGGAMIWPAVVEVGCTVYSSRAAGPGLTVNDALTVSGRPSVEAVSE